MIYLDLFLGFLKVGLFSFGGAYAAIPLIRDVVLSYGWMDDEMLSYMIAVSESTPGPIMVNVATYVGTSQGGVLGALVATFAVVLPSFLIILILTAILSKVTKNKYLQAVLKGVKPCVAGIILATGCWMVFENVFGANVAEIDADVRAVIITVILGVIYFGQKAILGKKDRKLKISPIMLIMISAVLGIAGYSF